ncbi:uncharacterized protein RCO7_14696 [Rhynchosporium graminicola]|uniref:Uncharacterized protein n=1 Tax=Rhynchosporium graminicola TaxID=2792576 RepID=A0A1E1KWJ3_9HELO|nr:uncharacterized protein RCO7_14696 [Rhynchosporium commune]
MGMENRSLVKLYTRSLSRPMCDWNEDYASSAMIRQDLDSELRSSVGGTSRQCRWLLTAVDSHYNLKLSGNSAQEKDNYYSKYSRSPQNLTLSRSEASGVIEQLSASPEVLIWQVIQGALSRLIQEILEHSYTWPFSRELEEDGFRARPHAVWIGEILPATGQRDSTPLIMTIDEWTSSNIKKLVRNTQSETECDYIAFLWQPKRIYHDLYSASADWDNIWHVA